MHLRKRIPAFFLLLSCIFFMSVPVALFGQEPQQKLPEKTRILFLLDGSGSMLAKWGNTYRIAVAKRMLADFVDSLQVNENLELALRVYGHQYDRRLKRCDDSRLEVPFSKNNHETIKNFLKTIAPKGTTPIAYSLAEAAKDFPTRSDIRNIIIIITDGIESCDGDPCEVSLQLQRKNIFLKPFIIGIGMDKKFEEQFGCMGNFYDATDIAGFRHALNTALHQSLDKTTVSVELLDIDDKPKETDVNISFINNFTQTSAFEFVHYRDRLGRPDTVEIDPVLTYDIVVNTIPPITKKGVNFIAGQHNVLSVKAPQGYLSLYLPGYTEYKDGIIAILKKPGNPEILTTFNVPGKEKLLVGKYDVTVNTIPKRTFKNVQINQSATTALNLKKPGVVNFVVTSPGIGSLYEIFEDGSQQWIHNLNPELLRNVITMQPGNYKAVFRSEKAKGSKFTVIKEFTIREGSSLIINL